MYIVMLHKSDPHPQVILEDLELRTDCLDGLGAALSLQGGYIGHLSIQIPWNALTSKPVIIELDRVHLILHPQQDVSVDSKSEAAYAALSKQASIAAAELANSSWKNALVSRLLNRAVSGIQLRILS